ncbi:MAG: rhomboid family intramembrane serine protease [Acidimicrobiia bacterium]|nr:rhomboid family intramembrane serine protease [Acidimicrobiia bacterium]
MIPIRDTNPTVIRPFVNWLIIAGAVLVFFMLQPQTEPAGTAFAFEWAAIPCELTTMDPLDVRELETAICLSSGQAGSDLFPEKSVMLGVLVSMFLHGGLGHLIGNMWMLWIFGNNAEEAFGSGGYLLFYLLSGVAATAGYVLLNPDGTVPLVGASGAIAGVMGAYLVLFPRAQVVSLVPFFFFIPFNVPAGIYLMIWFAGQFAISGEAGQIAWEAHVAGFAFGVAVALLLRRRLLRRVARLQRLAVPRRIRRR